MEKGVLSSMLVGGRATIAECAEKISSNHLFVPAHRTIYNVLVEMCQGNQQIDLLTVTEELRKQNLLEMVGGAAAVTDLQTLTSELNNFVPTAANIEYYLNSVRDKYAQRRIIKVATECVRRAYEPSEDIGETIAFISQQLDNFKCPGKNGLPPIEDAAQLISKPIVLPDDVIEGVLHRGGKMVLGDASKTFKTWTLVDLAVSVAAGRDWLAKFPTKRGHVLYINLELQAAFFTNRVRVVCDENQVNLEPGYLSIRNLRGHAADLTKLLPLILHGISGSQYDLIILDPIYKLLGQRDENKAGDIASLLNEIESLAVKTGAAVAFGAHYSKGNQAGKEVIDRIGGSGVFARDPDSILNFTKHEQEDCFTVEATLRNHPPIEPFVVRWEFPIMCVDSTLNPAQLKQAGRPETYHAEDLRALIVEEMSATEIVKMAEAELLWPRRRTFEALKELKKDGSLKQPEKRGNYVPA